jgi:tetratricopeptide (TPR) repeat protein
MNRLETLRQLVERNPKDSFALYGLAMEYAGQGEYDKALEKFGALCEVSPNYSYGYYQAGRVLTKMGRIDEARAWYVRGIEATARSGDQHARGEIEAALAEIGTGSEK